MSSRQERRKACNGKTKFDTISLAERAATSLMRAKGGWIVAYQCRFCGNFHIGHPPRRVRQSLIDKAHSKGKYEH